MRKREAMYLQGVLGKVEMSEQAKVLQTLYFQYLDNLPP